MWSIRRIASLACDALLRACVRPARIAEGLSLAAPKLSHAPAQLIAVTLLSVGPAWAESNTAANSHIQGVISGIQVIVPITNDLFVEVAEGTRNVPLWFFNDEARRRSGELISELAKDGALTIASFSYNFDRESGCAIPGWQDNSCQPVGGGTDAAFLSQIVISATKGERSVASAYPLEVEAAEENGGVFQQEDEMFFSWRAGERSWTFHCSLVENETENTSCSTWYYPHRNLSFRFSYILRTENLGLPILQDLSVAASQLIEQFTSGDDFR